MCDSHGPLSPSVHEDETDGDSDIFLPGTAQASRKVVCLGQADGPTPGNLYVYPSTETHAEAEIMVPTNITRNKTGNFAAAVHQT